MRNSILRLGMFISLVSSVMSISCSKTNTNSRTETFFLQDSIFKISMDVPNELDTFNAWLHFSDNTCAHARKYRFSNSKYPIVKEDGFIWYEPDSAYSLTIRHVDRYLCNESYSRETLKDLEASIQNLKTRSQVDTAELHLYSYYMTTSNNLEYSVVTYGLVPLKQPQYEITSAHTAIDSTEFSITFECVGKKCDGFAKKMEGYLKSIELVQLKSRLTTK